MQISLHDGNKSEWVKWVKFGLAHRERMKAASELAEAERPKPNASIDIEQFHDAVTFLRAVDCRIPEETARQAISLISSARLLQDFELSKAHVVELKNTSVLALVFPLPEISRFSMPPPFKVVQHHTWALIHGTPIQSACDILLEGFIRPANWTYNKNLLKSDVPTFGTFYLGREISQTDHFPDWASKELMGNAQKRGKGQQDVLIAALYRGAEAHISYKAGGKEAAQISVADTSIATTSEKYTIAHSKHVGLKFFALKWQNLQIDDDDERSSSEDLTCRGINRCTEEQQPGSQDPQKRASHT